jgi:hypothetical protein
VGISGAMAISIEKYATMPSLSERPIEEKLRCWFEKCILLLSLFPGFPVPQHHR